MVGSACARWLLDAILDRLIYRSHRLKMKGPSMRKLKAENVKETKEK